MTRIHTIIFGCILLTLSACAPDPSEVCEHMIEVMKNDGDKPKFLDDEDSCVERMEGVKSRYGANSYRREVACLLSVDTGYKMRTCMSDEKRHRD